ncbi:hypothetical protein E4U23_005391 [Claviceps purpurea]|nr:hypothetical protein E4U23_005391 [Claviceps purpurea]
MHSIPKHLPHSRKSEPPPGSGHPVSQLQIYKWANGQNGKRHYAVFRGDPYHPQPAPTFPAFPNLRRSPHLQGTQYDAGYSTITPLPILHG